MSLARDPQIEIDISNAKKGKEALNARYGIHTHRVMWKLCESMTDHEWLKFVRRRNAQGIRNGDNAELLISIIDGLK